jgi:hypothetical protein
MNLLSLISTGGSNDELQLKGAIEQNFYFATDISSLAAKAQPT